MPHVDLNYRPSARGITPRVMQNDKYTKFRIRSNTVYEALDGSRRCTVIYEEVISFNHSTSQVMHYNLSTKTCLGKWQSFKSAGINLPEYVHRQFNDLSERAVLRPGLKAMLPQIVQLCGWLDENKNGLDRMNFSDAFPHWKDIEYILSGPEYDFVFTDYKIFIVKGRRFFVPRRPHWSKDLSKLVTFYDDQFRLFDGYGD